MAADLVISERIYAELRRRLLAGQFRLSERMDVNRIAGEMRASATPVREALTRLAAEGLIAARPARGFFAVLWSESGLRSLYEWRGALVRLAVEADPKVVQHPRAGAQTADYAESVRALFAAIEKGANPELRHAAANADDRLHAARCVEPEVLAGCEAELGAIKSAQTTRQLLAALRRYHTRRQIQAALLRERAMLRVLPPNGQ